MSKVKIQGNASGTGVVTLTAPNTNADRTITLPDSGGTVLDSTSTLDATKLAGALPAIDGSALTALIGSLTYSGGTTLSGLKILVGELTTPASAALAGDSYGISCRYYVNVVINYTGFAATPQVFSGIRTGYHEAKVAGISAISATSCNVRISCSRSAGITSIPFEYLIIGKAV
jgi:hypothetical protein